MDLVIKTYLQPSAYSIDCLIGEHLSNYSIEKVINYWKMKKNNNNMYIFFATTTQKH